jgi:uncharacterized protein (DUF4415 family)
METESQAEPEDRTDLRRLRAMTDEEIEAAVRDDPDAAPLDIDWSEARVVTNPPGAEPVMLLLDRDVLEWFRAQGNSQMRVNAVLRAFYGANREREAKA